MQLETTIYINLSQSLKDKYHSFSFIYLRIQRYIKQCMHTDNINVKVELSRRTKGTSGSKASERKNMLQVHYVPAQSGLM